LQFFSIKHHQLVLDGPGTTLKTWGGKTQFW